MEGKRKAYLAMHLQKVQVLGTSEIGYGDTEYGRGDYPAAKEESEYDARIFAHMFTGGCYKRNTGVALYVRRDSAATELKQRNVIGTELQMVVVDMKMHETRL